MDAARLPRSRGRPPGNATPHPKPKQTIKKQLTRISVLQSSKIVTALYVLIGFIYTAIGIPMVLAGGEKLRGLGFVYIAMPLVMGIFGFIFFAIFAALYNLLAKWLGGIEVEVKEVE